MSSHIEFNKIRYHQLSNIQQGLDDFKCTKPSFEEYLKVSAFHEQHEQVGQTWLFTYEKKIIGFITIAMAHMKPTPKLPIDTFGNIPSLLIGHLATHKDYERKGVGKYMVWWAINKAAELSESVGCRTVTLNPDKDVIEFYKKLKFRYGNSNAEDDVMFFDVKRFS